MQKIFAHRSKDAGTAAEKGSPVTNRFNLDSLRGQLQPGLAQKLFSLIKSEGHIIESYESAGRERAAYASQLSTWGESTEDDTVSEVSDKLAVLFAQVAEVENDFAEQLEESRAVLKLIRNAEKDVGPIRDRKAKVADEIVKLQTKDPESLKIVELEQERVRIEAESLVAEAQLTNITRQKLKHAYDLHTAAMIERAEKQAIIGKHARSLLQLIEDTPIEPGTTRPVFDDHEQAGVILSHAKSDLHGWHPSYESISIESNRLHTNAMPIEAPPEQSQQTAPTEGANPAP